jgi:hypothetical protein
MNGELVVGEFGFIILGKLRDFVLVLGESTTEGVILLLERGLTKLEGADLFEFGFENGVETLDLLTSGGDFLLILSNFAIKIQILLKFSIKIIIFLNQLFISILILL